MVKWGVGVGVACLVVGLALAMMPHGIDRATADQVTTPSFDQDHAWNDLTYQVHAGFRIPGTPVHRQVRDWLMKNLADSANVVTTQPFTHMLGGHEVTMWNIIADFYGTAKGKKGKILLAAHWDSRPISDQDPNPANRALPIDGADDGASAVAVLAGDRAPVESTAGRARCDHRADGW